MNRKIEFRAFDKETGKMHYLINKPYDEKTVDDELVVQIDCTGATGYTKNKYIGDCLMQYTGLLDKNGKKIFKGDIIRRIEEKPSKFHFQIYDPSPLISQIFYDKAAFFVKGVAGMDIYLGAVHQKIEVIGNIFENPELMEG
jgi:uncharacterized phage protein (TIGR01671 family)